MPKMKTHSSAKKRFKITAKGKVKAKAAFTSHMMMNKPKSMKRKARALAPMAEADEKIVLRNFLPYGRKKQNSKPYIKGEK
tara:strand:+ start:562 stop:804 length:243 start_codon:yes stop_codon:yes gene_type:complete